MAMVRDEGEIMATHALNRWVVVAGGILIQLCLGAIYAWSAFTNRLVQPPLELSRTQTQVIFSVGLASFAVVMALVAGRWQARSGPRVVSLPGGLVMGLGYVLASFAGTGPSAFWIILLGIGVIGGAGIGLAYVCPIAALVKWFPDRKGFITGLAVAGFGFGALVWVKLTGGFRFGPLDLTPGWAGLYGDGWTLSEVFRLYGGLFAGLVALGSMVMVNPPAGWRPDRIAGRLDRNGPRGLSPQPAADDEEGFTVRAMVATPQFWGIFLAFAFSATAGLMVIGVIRLFGVDALTGRAVAPAEAAVITATAMGLFYALFNGVGRIAWGVLSDRTGRRNAIVLMCGLQGVMMMLLPLIGVTEWGLYAGAALIGFNFGGNFALFPAATADLFGDRNVGRNYPWVFLAYGVGGLVGPVLGGWMGDGQRWAWAFIPAGVACFAGAAIMLAVTTPRRAVAETAPPLRKAA
jgi:OFA family oxalate/formate antiporter-like MFS transporter